MPFGPHVLSSLEDALSDGFEYHRSLDQFLIRAGLPDQVLAKLRASATTKARNSSRQWQTAPKRYVVQEVLTHLQNSGKDGDIIVANLITGMCKAALPAHAGARSAVEALRQQQIDDRSERAEAAAADRKEREQRERESDAAKQRKAEQEQKDREGLFDQFKGMIAQTDFHARGFALERLLTALFELEDLAPRSSFRIVGEQIDGSFDWRNKTHLVEAKWQKDPTAAKDFAQLEFKTSGKSYDTRGLMISINGYSGDGLIALSKKGPLKFVCIDGSHLMRAVQPGGSLRKVLEQVWRHADETGEAYFPVAAMRH